MLQINTKISSNPDVLETYKKYYGWIPGKNDIRPTELQISLKQNLLNNIYTKYNSSRDYILIELFYYNFTKTEEAKFKAIESRDNDLTKFECCRFKYQISNKTFHYILWFTTNKQNLNEQKINKIIFNSIQNTIHTDKFSFVWYENPKMTILDIYHVQVFFIKN